MADERWKAQRKLDTLQDWYSFRFAVLLYRNAKNQRRARIILLFLLTAGYRPMLMAKRKTKRLPLVTAVPCAFLARYPRLGCIVAFEKRKYLTWRVERILRMLITLGSVVPRAPQELVYWNARLDIYYNSTSFCSKEREQPAFYARHRSLFPCTCEKFIVPRPREIARETLH